jgi:D-3-phosphoglycerate dehydrogenase
MTVYVIDSRFPESALEGLDIAREPRADVQAVVTFGNAVPRSVIDVLPALRVIATASVGYDHIDVEAAAARGIWVANAGAYCVDEVADHTLALLLSLLRGVVRLNESVHEGQWLMETPGPLRTLAGLRVGIVGCGRIGSAVAIRLESLRCVVRVSDIRPIDDFEQVRLAELLEWAEAVSIHVPLTSATRGLIGPRELARMRHGAVLVNTSRGPVVDVDAVLAALRDGRLGGAGLDVLPVEPPEPPPVAPNLVLTPHAAWYSAESPGRSFAAAADAVRTALGGDRPANAVPETP